MVKQVQTKLTTVFTGSYKTVAEETKIEKPKNPQEVIDKNTKKTVIIKFERKPPCLS